MNLENKRLGKRHERKEKKFKNGKKRISFHLPLQTQIANSAIRIIYNLNHKKQMDVLLVCRLRSKVSKALERLTLSG